MGAITNSRNNKVGIAPTNIHKELYMADICSINPQIISGAAIAAIGWIAGYFSARRIANINTRNTASAKLRAAFAPCLARISLAPDIQRNGTSEIGDFFKDVWLNHAAAIEEFRPFVSDSAAYEKAWDDYKNTISEKSIHDGGIGWDTGFVVTANGDEVPYRPIVKRNIELILEFTNQQHSTHWFDIAFKKAKMIIYRN